MQVHPSGRDRDLWGARVAAPPRSKPNRGIENPRESLQVLVSDDSKPVGAAELPRRPVSGRSA